MPKVEEHDAAVVSSHHVVRLHVAMNQPRAVGRCERAGHLDDRQHAGARKAHDAIVDRRAHRAAGDELHDEERTAVVGLADVVDVDDARMLERRTRQRFTEQSLPRRQIPQRFGRQNFDRDLARELRVGRAVHGAHASCADPCT